MREGVAYDKRTAIAVFVSLFVIFAYTELVIGPQKPPRVAESARPTVPPSEGEIQNAQSSVTAPPPVVSDGTVASPSAPLKTVTQDEIKNAQQNWVETGELRIAVSHLGTKITAFQLLHHKTSLEDTRPFDKIFSETPSFPLQLSVAGGSDAGVQYSLSGYTDGVKKIGDRFILESGDSLNLHFTGVLPSGETVSKTLTFNGSGYMFDVRAELSSPAKDGSALALEWDQFVSPKFESSRYNQLQYLVLESASDSVETFTPEEVDTRWKSFDGKWVSFGDTYFISALIPTNPVSEVRISREDHLHRLQVVGTSQAVSMKGYVGPKDQDDLEASGYGLERTIDFGWIAFVGQPILRMTQFLYGILGNYGLAIVLLTLLMKIALLPLTKTSFRSMKAMQDLQPEIAALRERIKDPTQMHQEMMALYKKRGVNPMGGCLPLLLQTPIFFGMYNALLVSVDMRHAPFALWITDLSAPERLTLFGVPVPVMIVIMGLTMLLQQLTTPSTMDPQQKKAMLVVPIIFTGMFIVFPFPSGLVLYMLVNNFVSVAQQTALRSERQINPWYVSLGAAAVIFTIAYVLTLFPQWS